MKIPELKNPIICNGDGTCKVVLPGRKLHYAIVNNKDLFKITGQKWHFSNGYAKTTRGKYGRNMSNAILETHEIVDHINNDKLNNTFQNLRIVTSRQNSLNSSPSGRSKYKGVSFCKCTNKWVVRIRQNKKYLNLGRFNCEVEAAKTYNEKAKELFGEYAYLNDV